MKSILRNTFKALGIGLIFFIGVIIGGMLASAVGLPAPALPEGTDPATMMPLLLASSFGIGAALAYLASRLTGPLALRWLVLSGFGWGLYSLNTYLDAVIYTTLDSASPYKLVMDAVAFTAAGGFAVLFFRQKTTTPQAAPRFSLSGWAWRLALAWAAFPLIYLAFGKIVEPFVIDMYRQQMLGLTAPGWGQIIPIQMLRSLVFLLTALGVMRLWSGPRRMPWTVLGVLIFLLLWAFYALQAYWMPLGFRFAHSLEILADSLVYAGVLSLLFNQREAPAAALAASEAA